MSKSLVVHWELGGWHGQCYERNTKCSKLHNVLWGTVYKIIWKWLSMLELIRRLLFMVDTRGSLWRRWRIPGKICRRLSRFVNWFLPIYKYWATISVLMRSLLLQVKVNRLALFLMAKMYFCHLGSAVFNCLSGKQLSEAIISSKLIDI